jgi:hypothetical protein
MNRDRPLLRDAVELGEYIMPHCDPQDSFLLKQSSVADFERVNLFFLSARGFTRARRRHQCRCQRAVRFPREDKDLFCKSCNHLFSAHTGNVDDADARTDLPPSGMARQHIFQHRHRRIPLYRARLHLPPILPTLNRHWLQPAFLVISNSSSVEVVPLSEQIDSWTATIMQTGVFL